MRSVKTFQVDGSYAVVKFPAKDFSGVDLQGNKEDLATLLQDCRLLRKDELMIVKGASAPRIPDCFQKTPKKVTVSENGQILAVTVDGEGMDDSRFNVTLRFLFCSVFNS